MSFETDNAAHPTPPSDINPAPVEPQNNTHLESAAQASTESTNAPAASFPDAADAAFKSSRHHEDPADAALSSTKKYADPADAAFTSEPLQTDPVDISSNDIHAADSNPPSESKPDADTQSANDPTAKNVHEYESKTSKDPEDYRMSIGEHLEELRNRLFLGAIGFIVAFAVWMFFGTQAVTIFCRPLQIALWRNGLPMSIYFTSVEEPFMVYIRVSLILAFVTASPWLLYQVWQFIAAGLYPKERKYVTAYLPLSIGLLVAGMLFLYFYVLPMMLEFFIAFHISSSPKVAIPTSTTQAITQPLVVPMLDNDPTSPAVGSLWFDRSTSMIKFRLTEKDTRVISFGSTMLTTPIITLATYIDMVMGMLFSFGIAFQMPLIVLALNKIGLMSIARLKEWRRFVYFFMTILAACIVPDVATGMIALLVPLILLYELGILLATWSSKRAAAEETVTAD